MRWRGCTARDRRRHRVAALRIDNRQSFLDLEWLTAGWDLLVDGEVARRGRLRVPPVGPLSGVSLEVPCQVPARTPRCAAHRAVDDRGEQWWAPAGHLVAWDQIRLRRSPAAARRASSGGRPSDALVEPPLLNLWRAATDNDGFKLMPELAQRLRVGGQALRRWQEAGVDRRPQTSWSTTRCRSPTTVPGARYRHVVVVPESLTDLPRVGVPFAVDPVASSDFAGSAGGRTRTIPTATARR